MGKTLSPSWLSNQCSEKDTVQILRKCLLRFVFEAECIGSSKQTKGFIDDLDVNSESRVRNFISYLSLDNQEKIHFRYFNSTSELEKALKEDGYDSDDFIDGDKEFIYMVFGGTRATAARVKQLPVFCREKQKGKTRAKKADFYRIDSLFRHLRNALAHGQCRRVVKNQGTYYWAIQDNNAKGSITARMLLSEETLDKWLDLLCKRDKRYRIKQ